MGANEFDMIRDQATFLRSSFEHILEDSIGTSETRGACLHASILLSQMLSKFAGATCKVCGGGPPMDGGILDKAGVLRGHYWVEGYTASGQAFAVDITADQFGFEDVVLLADTEARTRYFQGNPALIAQHVLEEQSSWSAAAGK